MNPICHLKYSPNLIQSHSYLDAGTAVARARIYSGLHCGPTRSFMRSQQLVYGLKPWTLRTCVHSPVAQRGAASGALTNDAPQALAQALLPYAVAQGQQPDHVSPASMLVNSSGCSTAPSQSPAPRMPTAATLMAEGRADLVQRVKQAGGFTKVAQTLGWTGTRKAAGHWDELSVLDRELSAVIHAAWLELPHPDTGKPYYYNQFSGRATLRKPGKVTTGPNLKRSQGSSMTAGSGSGSGSGSFSATGAAGSDAASSDPEHVMPSRSMLRRAGREELHYAVLRHGGYAAVAAQLGRRPLWGRTAELATDAALREGLLGVQQELDLADDVMPSRQQLLEVARSDLVEAVRLAGGFAVVASQLGLTPSRARPRTYWHVLDNVVSELQQYIQEHQEQQRHTQQRQQPCAQHDGPDSDVTMPTLHALRAAGRGDLAFGITLHGVQQVAGALGLCVGSRGTNRGALQWDDVQAALQAGAESPAAVRTWLYEQRGVSIGRQYLTETLSSAAKEGRLIRIARGRYALPFGDSPSMASRP